MPEYMTLRSEQVGGLLSLAGSFLPVAAGDVQSVAAAGMFLAAEICLVRAGHKVGGYSSGAAAFAAGDFMLAASPAVANNPALQASLIAMGAVWAIGAARYPIYVIAKNTLSSRPAFSRAAQKTADIIQPFVSVSCLILRAPGLASSISGGTHLMTGALTLWTLSDIFTGRLQHYARPLYRSLKRVF